jgi:hypothetical protein
MEIQTILIAVLVVAVVVFGAWYIWRSMREDRTEATEQIGDDSQVKGGASIPIAARAKGLSRPAKVMFGSIGLLFVVLAIFIYQTLSTGSPAEILFADQLRTAGVALVGVVGGVIISNVASRNEGYLYNIYETNSGETRTEVVPIDTSGIEADSEGHEIVSEYNRRRIMGLFRRYKHVGEDAELDGSHRAPGKIIKHQIADHAVEVDDGEWVQRTSGRNATTSPSVEPDYIYDAPIELSYDRYLKMKESVRRMEKRLHGAQATIAVIEDEFEKLRDRLEMGEYDAEETILDKFERMADILQQQDDTDPANRDARSTHVSMTGQADSRQTPPQQMANGDGGGK